MKNWFLQTRNAIKTRKFVKEAKQSDRMLKEHQEISGKLAK